MSDELEHIWSRVQDELSQAVDEPTYRIWLEALGTDASIDRIVCVLTSADHEGTRRNPLSTAQRIEIMRPLLEAAQKPYMLIAISDIPTTRVWVAHVVDQVKAQTGLQLLVGNTRVYTANHDVDRAFRAEGYGIVSQAGVLDMVTAADTGVGGTAESDFLGGSPAAVPERYRLADPIQAVPLKAPVLCVHAQGDQNVPYAQSTAYVAAATKAGGKAALHTVAGNHFTLIDPSSAAWAVVVDALPQLLAGRLPR